MELYFLFQQKEKNHSDSLGDLLLNRAKVQKDMVSAYAMGGLQDRSPACRRLS
jgi:hypothetical protein